jgi:hypothetical protein
MNRLNYDDNLDVVQRYVDDESATKPQALCVGVGGRP